MSAFINEFHYDNTGTDTGEFVEIAGPAGFDLTGWSLVLYNGSNGTSYNTIALSGILADSSNGFGFLTVTPPTLQNGSPDGMALVDADGNLVEFLSYEGSFTANEGPANGVTSTDIGVTEPNDTPVGFSLQRAGTGTDPSDFTFAAAQAETPGAVNTGQVFGVLIPSLVINEIHADPASGTPGDANGDGTRNSGDDEFVEIVNTGTTDADLSGATISDGIGTRHIFAANTTLAPGEAIVVFGGGTPTGTFGDATVQTASTGALGLNNPGDTVTLALADGTVIDEVEFGSEGGNNQSLTRDPDLTGSFVQHSGATGANGALYSPGTQIDGTPFNEGGPVFTINEVDADNPGMDVVEFIEIYDGGVGNSSLDGLVVVLFNGSDDASYDAFDLDGQSTDENGFFVIGSSDVANVDLVAFTNDGVQNGADAVALYEGSAADFPDDTPATTTNLLDAIVYDTNDGDDTDLLTALGQTVQYNEDEAGDKDNDSLSRLPDGSGEFVVQAPTPGASNDDTGGGGGGGGTDTQTITLIHAVQGSSDFSAIPTPQVEVDDISPLLDQIVTIEAIVTGDFQEGDVAGIDQAALGGFYVQEEDSDADTDDMTSEGLFVFDAFANLGSDVNVGDLVRVTGMVSEFFGKTQISASSVEVLSSGNTLPTSTVVDLGSTGAMLDRSGDWVVNLEAVEGMLITIPEDLAVTEMFNLDRFGEYRVSAGGRLEQFTQNNAPDVAGFAAHQQDIAARSLVLDDGRTTQNPETIEIIDGNDGVLTASDSFRMGDTLSNVTGVLDFSFNEFRLHDATGDYAASNPRPESPVDVGGDLTVASLNVLNFFTTLDAGGARTDTNNEPRGADNSEEFDRQREKLVNAIVEMDADILGLVEIENSATDAAVADLVDAINAQTGTTTYDYIATGIVGSDAITQALIYKPATVTPTGDFQALTTFNGIDFTDPLDAGRGLNRPALAQTFTEIASGEMLTVAVNHLKSKGSLSGLAVDDDQLDGAGNNNATREAAAELLADWLASDPTGQGAENVLIIGDLNAYQNETPITALEAAGYTDLAEEFVDDPATPESENRSFVFDGQSGTLDYILANEAVLDNVTGVAEWHINADEADAIDYNLDFERPADLFDGTNPARHSDHDPVIVGLSLSENDPPVAAADSYTLQEGETLNQDAQLGVLANDSDPDNDPLTADLVSGPDNAADFTLNGDGSFTYTPVADFSGTDSFDYAVSDGTASTTQTATLTVNPGDLIGGSDSTDFLTGDADDNTFASGAGFIDLMDLRDGGSDVIVFGDETANGTREFDYVLGFGSDDKLDLGGATIGSELNFFGRTLLFLESDNDVIVLFGVNDFDETSQILAMV